MELVLATKNINKIKRLKKIINRIFPEIILTDVYDSNIEAPQENDFSQEENLEIKLNYYHRLLNKNVISEDDVVELKIKGEYVPIVKVNNFFEDGNNLYKNWISYLDKNNIAEGQLIKSYGVVINDKIKMAKLVIPLIIKTKKIVKKNKEINVLNNFIGPMETGKTFNEMSKKERDEYMNKLYEPLIKQLMETK